MQQSHIVIVDGELFIYKYLKTTNSIERLNEEAHKRERGVGIFPNEASTI